MLIVFFTCSIVVSLVSIVDFIGYSFSHPVMLLASYGNAHYVHLDTYYFIIVVYSTYFVVFIALLDYYHNMLTSSYHMIFYPILSMYTLIIAHF